MTNEPVGSARWGRIANAAPVKIAGERADAGHTRPIGSGRRGTPHPLGQAFHERSFGQVSGAKGLWSNCRTSARREEAEAIIIVCSVCHAPVNLLGTAGLVYEHWASDDAPCSGSGRRPFSGPPSADCAVCGGYKPVRDSDGRIGYHRVGGQRCDGSGRTPLGGRASGHLSGLGVSKVVRGGSPGLGKRR
jgi:hypothetical protein